jgi:alpha-1,6-mannosyltransferase
VFVLLWLYLLLKRRMEAPIALAASVLCKYVTAPLLLVDLIFFLRSGRGSWPRYGLRMLAPAVVGLAVGAIFYRSPAFFDGVLLVGAWRFLQPQDALRALELKLGIPSTALGIAAAAVIPAAALYQAAIAWTNATRDNILKLIVAVVSAVLFAGVSHVWPWYIVWALAPAALVPTWWLSRYVIGIAMIAPFTIAAWWIEPFEHHTEVAALAMYAGALAWAWATRRDADPVLQPSRQTGHAGVPASTPGVVAGG